MALNGGADEVEARRERLDRASRAMGGLLLRGYRMLGSSCPLCGTILLQDKEQRLLCVTCQDPEGPGGGHAPPPPPAPSPAAPRPEHCEGAAAAFRGAPPAPAEPPGGGGAAAVAAARAAVLQKLLWAAQELPRTASAEGSAHLCRLVRDCADALGGCRPWTPPAGPPSPPRPPERPPGKIPSGASPLLGSHKGCPWCPPQRVWGLLGGLGGPAGILGGPGGAWGGLGGFGGSRGDLGGPGGFGGSRGDFEESRGDFGGSRGIWGVWVLMD